MAGQRLPFGAIAANIRYGFMEGFGVTIYRLGTFFVLSILDDPAMLALAFC